jgi:hypothetical protein
LEILLSLTLEIIVNIRRWRREENYSYTSVVEVEKFVRERYIRVAAIVIVITAGS